VDTDDPVLEGLVRALTADGTADELAGRAAAAQMFRDSRRRPRRLRLAVSMSTAAAAVVLAGGIGAAYGAALPAPVQHIAYRMLGRIGVPDTRHPAPSSGAPGAAASIPATASAPPTAACPCPASRRVVSAAQTLVLAAAWTRIPADGDDVLSGRLAPGGRPAAGVRVRLLEHDAGRPGWRVAGRAVTRRGGDVTLTVSHLTRDAAFRLAAPGGEVSPPVPITVIPPVHLDLVPGQQAGMATLTARAPFAQAGDTVVLEERSAGVWYRVTERVLGPGHLASFSVLIPRAGAVQYRVLIPRTASHGSSVSDQVRLAAPKPKTGRPART
jgi:hypothetical protein